MGRDTRNKLEGVDPARRDSFVVGGTFLGQVIDGGHRATANGDYYDLTNPVEVGSQEEDQAPIFSVDTSRVIPVAVIGQRPNVGDMLVGEYDGQRWFSVLGASGSPIDTRCGVPCGSCADGKMIPDFVPITDDNGTWMAGPPFSVGGTVHWNALGRKTLNLAEGNPGPGSWCPDAITGVIDYVIGLTCFGDGSGFSLGRAFYLAVYNFGGGFGFGCCNGTGDPFNGFRPVVYRNASSPVFYLCPRQSFTNKFTLPDCDHASWSGSFDNLDNLDPFGGGVSVKWTAKRAQVCCLPSPIPKKPLVATLIGPGGTITGTAKQVSGQEVWKTDCLGTASPLILGIECLGGSIRAWITHFISGGCPSGQSLTCASDGVSPGLVRVDYSPDPFHYHFAISGAACPAMADNGLTDLYFDE